MEFGQKLKMLIYRAGKQYNEFGFVATKSTIYRWTKGDSTPTLEQVQKLAEHFGVPISYLADDRFETPEQAVTGISPEERQYVERGRALGMEDAALLMGIVLKVASDTSLQEVYGRLLNTKPDERPSVGDPGPPGGPARLKVNVRGEGDPQPVAGHKPKPGRK